MQDANIPMMKLDPSTLRQEDRFEAWRQSVGPIIDVVPGETQVMKGAAFTTRLLDNLIFGEFKVGAQTILRGPSQINAPHSEFLMVDLYTSGTARGLMGDAYIERGPGIIDITDYSRQSQLVATDATFLSVSIPHNAISYDPSRHPANIRIPTDGPVGRILADAFHSLHAQLPEVKMSEAPAVAAGFRGLLSGLVLGAPDEDAVLVAVKSGRLNAMKTYLEQNLTNPNLGVEGLCRTFGASRASVYRDFAELGGVVNYITQCRLDRAFRELLGSAPTRGRVQAIAARWGFDSPGHFNRIFRQRFGESPSTTLGLMPFSEPASHLNQLTGYDIGQVANFTDWMRRL